MVTIKSVAGLTGCPRCGLIAEGHARDAVTLIDAPSFGRAVRLVWHKRRYACHEPACAMATFVEQDETIAAPRALLTARAVDWALAQLRAEHASIAGLSRQLGVDWNTMWRALKTRLELLDANPTRFDGVRMLGVDNSPARCALKREAPSVCGTTSTSACAAPLMLTGMVDLTRDEHGRAHARLLDLAPRRSGSVYGDWLTRRGPVFRAGIEVAKLDPFHGYMNAIDDHLADTVAVVDAFHSVGLQSCCRRLRRGVKTKVFAEPADKADDCSHQGRHAKRVEHVFHGG